MYSVKKEVGDTELFILKDGETEFGKETFIVNDSNEIQRLLKLNDRQAIETNFNAFLVRTGERNILIDAGAGNLFGPAAGNLKYALLYIYTRDCPNKLFVFEIVALNIFKSLLISDGLLSLPIFILLSNLYQAFKLFISSSNTTYLLPNSF